MSASNEQQHVSAEGSAGEEAPKVERKVVAPDRKTLRMLESGATLNTVSSAAIGKTVEVKKSDKKEVEYRKIRNYLNIATNHERKKNAKRLKLLEHQESKGGLHTTMSVLGDMKKSKKLTAQGTNMLSRVARLGGAGPESPEADGGAGQDADGKTVDGPDPQCDPATYDDTERQELLAATQAAFDQDEILKRLQAGQNKLQDEYVVVTAQAVVDHACAPLLRKPRNMDQYLEGATALIEEIRHAQLPRLPQPKLPAIKINGRSARRSELEQAQNKGFVNNGPFSGPPYSPSPGVSLVSLNIPSLGRVSKSHAMAAACSPIGNTVRSAEAHGQHVRFDLEPHRFRLDVEIGYFTKMAPPLHRSRSHGRMVFAAFDPSKNIQCVLKTEPAGLRREDSALRREAQILAKLQEDEDQPGIPYVFAMGISMSCKKYMIVMEQLGPNIEHLFYYEIDGKKPSGYFDFKTVLLIAVQALRAIAYVHKCGFIHRSIKPSNFAVGQVNNQYNRKIIYLLDYGWAKDLSFIQAQQKITDISEDIKMDALDQRRSVGSAAASAAGGVVEDVHPSSKPSSDTGDHTGHGTRSNTTGDSSTEVGDAESSVEAVEVQDLADWRQYRETEKRTKNSFHADDDLVAVTKHLPHDNQVLFSSPQCHRNMLHATWRDDYMSLGYMLTWLLRGGNLPWSDLISVENLFPKPERSVKRRTRREKSIYRRPEDPRLSRVVTPEGQETPDDTDDASVLGLLDDSVARNLGDPRISDSGSYITPSDALFYSDSPQQHPHSGGAPVMDWQNADALSQHQAPAGLAAPGAEDLSIIALQRNATVTIHGRQVDLDPAYNVAKTNYVSNISQMLSGPLGTSVVAITNAICREKNAHHVEEMAPAYSVDELPLVLPKNLRHATAVVPAASYTDLVTPADEPLRTDLDEDFLFDRKQQYTLTLLTRKRVLDQLEKAKREIPATTVVAGVPSRHFRTNLVEFMNYAYEGRGVARLFRMGAGDEEDADGVEKPRLATWKQELAIINLPTNGNTYHAEKHAFDVNVRVKHDIDRLEKYFLEIAEKEGCNLAEPGFCWDDDYYDEQDKKLPAALLKEMRRTVGAQKFPQFVQRASVSRHDELHERTHQILKWEDRNEATEVAEFQRWSRLTANNAKAKAVVVTTSLRKEATLRRLPTIVPQGRRVKEHDMGSFKSSLKVPHELRAPPPEAAALA
ncbi:unnamed protein product [Amoebophrya sp. A25]|nr:unnamed protein product [Amoebophrya sp. A25]|eukprot:GSA25T00009745001.1